MKLALMFNALMPQEIEYKPSPSAHIREHVELYESSKGSEGGDLRGFPVVILTTTGARSGKLRKSPLIRVEHSGVYAAVASAAGAPNHPSWYFNALANPGVRLQDGGQVRELTAREARGEERVLWWSRAVERFPAYAEYQSKTERQLPVLLLEPLD